MYKIRNVNDFIKKFSKSVYEKIVKESTIGYNPIPSRDEFNEILKELYNELENYEYIPKNIRGKIFAYKSNNVARIIPVMEIKDEVFYYFVCKMLEDFIVGNRVEGTYGGWRIGNQISNVEGIELEYAYNSYNPKAWNKEWGNFQSIIDQELEISDDEVLIIKLDIANFYDNINLQLLEKKILSRTDNKSLIYVNMLTHFLRTWNMKTDKYHYKTVGLPQNEFGDQSRLLANLYLQGYDESINKFANNISAKYMRFSDDQLIFVKDKNKINDIMYVVCKELNSIGLNLNASKVKIYDKESLNIFYGKEIFKMLDQEKYNDSLKIFFKYYNKKVDFKYITPLRRFVNIDITSKRISQTYKIKIYKIITSEDFLVDCNVRYLIKIYNMLTPIRKTKFINKINNMLRYITYNSFHYSCINFFNKINKPIYISEIEERLKQISTM